MTLSPVDGAAVMRHGSSVMRFGVPGLVGVLVAAAFVGVAPVRAGTLPTECVGVPDGTACDDGDACTTDDACAAGVCAGDLSGTCWTTRGVVRAVASASAGGRTARCTLKCEAPGTGVLILGDDGTYRVPSGNYLPCPAVSTTPLPDEVGTVLPKRRRRLVLEPANLDELFAIAAECFDEANPFRRYSASLRFSRDGTTFKGRATLRGRQPGRIPVHLKSTVRVTGADVTTGIEPPPPSRKTLPICSDVLKPRCRVY